VAGITTRRRAGGIAWAGAFGAAGRSGPAARWRPPRGAADGGRSRVPRPS